MAFDVNRMEKTRHLLKTTAVLSIGRLVSHAATFLTIPIYTFYLSAAEYGGIDLLLVYTSLLLPLATMRLEASVFRFIAGARAGEDMDAAAILRYVLSRIGIGILLLGIVAITVQSVFSVPYVIYAWLLLAVQAYNAVTMEYIRAAGHSGAYTIANSLAGVWLLATTMVSVMGLNMGVSGALVAIISAQIASGLFCSWRIWRTQGATRSTGLSRTARRQLLSFSAPLVASALSWWAINASDKTIIAFTLGAAANGIYAVAGKFAAVLMVLFPIFGMALTESAVLHINAKDKDTFFSGVFRGALRVSFSLALLLIAGLGVALPLLIDPAFMEARHFLPILIGATFFNNITGLYSAIYIAKKMTRQIMNMSLIIAAMNIVLNLLFIGSIGLYAAAGSTLVAYAVMAVWRHLEIRRIIAVQYHTGTLISMAAAALVVCWLYYYNATWSNWLAVGVAGVTALILNWAVISRSYQALRRRGGAHNE